MSRAFSARSPSRSARTASTSARSAVISSGRISGLTTGIIALRQSRMLAQLMGESKRRRFPIKRRRHLAGQLRPPYARGVHPPPIEPFKQRCKLRCGQSHHPVADRRPLESRPFQPLPDQHQAGPIIDQYLHPVRPLRAKHEHGAAEGVLPEHQLYHRGQAIGTTSEINRTRRNQHSHSRRRRAREGGDHLMAFNRRSTLPRKPSSTPAPTRKVALPISNQLAGQNDRLRQLIRQLQRMQFGRRSEKLDPDQFNLALEDLEQAVAESEAEQEKADPALRKARSEKRRAGRGALPEHLPRVEIVVEPEETACPCCGSAMHVIGEDRSQRLDVIPAQYQVIVTRRPKYACRTCQGAIVQAPAPARLIEGGLPTEQLVAHVVVAKYADHCPLYRQAQILARQGITIDRTTLAFWTGYAAAELKPVWRLMRDELLGSTKLFVDETTAPVLDPGRGRTKKGCFWVLARDDRPWCGRAPPAVVYSYAPGRGGDHAAALLKGYSGVLQTDGYSAYRSLANPKRAGGPATLAFCWAHWRRQWFDVAKSPPAPIATEVLKRIAELYQIVA